MKILKYIILLIYVFNSFHLIGQSDREFLKYMHMKRFGEKVLKPINQSTDSIYSFFEKVDIVKFFTQEEKRYICNTPLFVEQLITQTGNMSESIISSMYRLNCWEIGEKSFSEMSYAFIDKIIYDKPFTSWDNEKVFSLYYENLKAKKRRERKKFALNFIDCDEPLVGHSNDFFWDPPIYQFTPPIFDYEYRTAMIFVKKAGVGFSILFFRRSQDENNTWQTWEFVFYYNQYGFSHEIYTKEWYKNRE